MVRTETFRSGIEHNVQLKPTHLPPEAPNKLIVSPTMNRWGNGDMGALPAMVLSVQEALSREKMSKDTWMIIGDASNKPDTDEQRVKSLQTIDQVPNPSRIFVLTPETQRKVADMIQNKIKIRRDVIDAILTNSGYASQRVKLDVVSAGLMLNNNTPIKVLTFDDDTTLPPERTMVKEDVLSSLNLKPLTNSQVLLNDELSSNGILKSIGDNRIDSFFKHIGKPVGKIKDEQSGMRATRGWTDTMHETLERATNGEPAQFVVTWADEEDIPEAENGIAIAAAATKSKIPDYRTVRIAQALLESDLPEEEVPVQSFPSGLNQLFAFLGCRTNIDSACLARYLDERTAFLPWWFVSKDAISRENPLKTVTGHYRADNELLPRLLEVRKEVTGELFMYLSGIDTQVNHHRARSGYRPHIIEQAAASLVGNIAALEAARRLNFGSPIGFAQMDRGGLDNGYKAPEDHAGNVYGEMYKLKLICEKKLRNLESEKPVNGRASIVNDKIEKFTQAQRLIKSKLGNSFDVFYQHLNVEIREQLKFYADVLDAMPVVIQEVQQLIKEGKYPVLEVRHPNEKK